MRYFMLTVIHLIYGCTGVYDKSGLSASFSKISQLQCTEATPTVLDFLSMPHLLIAAVYKSPSRNQRLLDIDLLNLKRPVSNFILAGDCNAHAHHFSWESNHSTLSGNKML